MTETKIVQELGRTDLLFAENLHRYQSSKTKYTVHNLNCVITQPSVLLSILLVPYYSYELSSSIYAKMYCM
jgi:hypothetical protein